MLKKPPKPITQQTSETSVTVATDHTHRVSRPSSNTSAHSASKPPSAPQKSLSRQSSQTNTSTKVATTEKATTEKATIDKATTDKATASSRIPHANRNPSPSAPPKRVLSSRPTSASSPVVQQTNSSNTASATHHEKHLPSRIPKPPSARLENAQTNSAPTKTAHDPTSSQKPSAIKADAAKNVASQGQGANRITTKPTGTINPTTRQTKPITTTTTTANTTSAKTASGAASSTLKQKPAQGNTATSQNSKATQRITPTSTNSVRTTNAKTSSATTSTKGHATVPRSTSHEVLGGIPQTQASPRSMKLTSLTHPITEGSSQSASHATKEVVSHHESDERESANAVYQAQRNVANLKISIPRNSMEGDAESDDADRDEQLNQLLHQADEVEDYRQMEYDGQDQYMQQPDDMDQNPGENEDYVAEDIELERNENPLYVDSPAKEVVDEEIGAPTEEQPKQSTRASRSRQSLERQLAQERQEKAELAAITEAIAQENARIFEFKHRSSSRKSEASVDQANDGQRKSSARSSSAKLDHQQHQDDSEVTFVPKFPYAQGKHAGDKPTNQDGNMSSNINHNHAIITSQECLIVGKHHAADVMQSAEDYGDLRPEMDPDYEDDEYAAHHESKPRSARVLRYTESYSQNPFPARKSSQAGSIHGSRSSSARDLVRESLHSLRQSVKSADLNPDARAYYDQEHLLPPPQDEIYAQHGDHSVGAKEEKPDPELDLAVRDEMDEIINQKHTATVLPAEGKSLLVRGESKKVLASVEDLQAELGFVPYNPSEEQDVNDHGGELEQGDDVGDGAEENDDDYAAEEFDQFEESASPLRPDNYHENEQENDDGEGGDEVFAEHYEDGYDPENAQEQPYDDAEEYAEGEYE
eukprot:TRINITY_DN2096_c1_g6_i1.p1 TRINITY_DN2096_c1_g6~~TRINITY_DN2096_c1_g6_i1.p1  ORF type:complete len:875 (+),score=247.81 TRINITY_DN2096_c1_g6_i1:53-2677(+)